MSNHGKFCWVELMTTDVAGARRFYGDVVGWSVMEVPMPGMDYAMWVKPGTEEPMGGLAVLDADAKAMGAPPHWLLHVAVDDVKAAVAKAASLGGKVILPATPIPEYGEFGIVADPQGAVFGVFKGNDPSPITGRDQTPGGMGWHELYTTDLAGAQAFYGALFGWKELGSFDMGHEMGGKYSLFGQTDTQYGGMMKHPPGQPITAWCPYFNVADVDAAAERIPGAGGKSFMTMDVPDGGRVTMGEDPQGAMFALFSPTGKGT